ncbi:cell division protein FtsQ/DivIB [Desulfosediminicola sp.]|uniref:cell division protein FtsQ/DivIB n=1 Tax=Desulfosediminicola sp. TaxID=2886825 RepID=UPI003AF24E49
MKLLQIRRKLNEFSDFLRQCKRELLSRKKGQTASNSDLRGYKFASTPEIKAKSKKQLWQIVSKKFRKKRVHVNNRYTQSGTLADSRKVWLAPAAVLLVVSSLFLALGGPGWVGMLLADLSFFKVRNIQYSGCRVVPEEEIRQLSGITLYQTSLLGLDQARVVNNIGKHPWVSQVSIKRNWPTDIAISVKEYTPVALMNVVTSGKPQLYYVDRYGLPFLRVSAEDDVDFPVITGLDRVNDEQEKKAIFSDVYDFIRVVSQNNPNLPAQSVSEIHINERGELVVYLVDYKFPIFFGRGEIRQKYSRLLRVLDSLYRGRGKGVLLSGVEYIRMDYYNGKVLVAQSESS